MDHMLREDFAINGNSVHSLDNSTQWPDATSFTEYRVAVMIWTVYSPCLLLLGGFGNIATILVMRRLKDHNSSQYAILMALAMSDLLLLYSSVTRSWVHNLFNVNLWDAHVLACKFQKWFIYCANTTSAWLVTAVTVQRTMAVLWPHRMRVMCTVRRTWVVIAVIVLTVCLLYFHLLLGTDMSTNNRCGIGVGLYAYFSRHFFIWIDMCLSSLIPSICLLICDVVLSFILFQATTSSSSSSTAVHVTSNVSGAHSSDSRRKKASRTTVMILTLSFTFVVLTLPMYAFYGFWYMDETGHMMKPPRVLARYKLVSTTVMLLWYSNSAINFLLYCLAGSKYRREFLSLLHCGDQFVSSSISSSSSVGDTSAGSRSGGPYKQSDSCSTTQLSTLSSSFSGQR